MDTTLLGLRSVSYPGVGALMSGSLAVPLRIKLISMDAKVRFPLWTL